MLTTSVLAGTLHEDQLELEREMSIRGQSRYLEARRHAEAKGDGAMLKPAERVVQHWYRPLEALIDAKCREFSKPDYQDTGLFAAPLLLSLEPKLLAAITLRDVIGEFLNPKSPKPITLFRMCNAIGRSCFAEMNMDLLAKNERDMYRMMTARMKRLDPSKVNFWAYQSLERPLTYRKTCLHAGAILLNMLLESASCGDYDEDVFEPAFRVEKVPIPGKKHHQRCVLMAESIVEIIEDGHDLRQLCRPTYSPMIVPPTQGTRDVDGGYLRARYPLVSKVRGQQRRKINAYRKAGRLDRLLEAVGWCDQTAWRINRRVVGVQDAVWRAGGDEALGIPAVAKMPMPPKPAGFKHDARGAEAWESVDQEAKKRWKRDAVRAHSHNIEQAGLKTQFLLALTDAQRYAEYDAFYLPHGLDFRGRMYPKPAILSHQRGDPVRALFEFAHPVDGDTERWLFIHAANCYGVDKVSFDDRVQWVRDHASDIIMSANHPLRCDFWKGADKPWQFLAACYALDDPEHGRRMPVQMDGSCNGLQHLSAMTRDEGMARAVNLMDGPVPGDVYRLVADAAVEVARATGRHDLVEWLTRPIVKRPVMTSVYGLTAWSARKYVREAVLEAGGGKEWANENADAIWKLIEKGMKGACRGAEEAMDWLSGVGSRLASKGILAEWEHPLGLPVVNPHINARECTVRTTLGVMTVYDFDDEKYQSPRKSKQRNGMAPNYVHTLDAAHLQMTALRMKAEAMAFAGVHDSYWTHAAHTAAMMRMLREAFVELHQVAKLDDYHRELTAKYPQIVFPEPPRLGTLDIDSVADSTYFFH